MDLQDKWVKGFTSTLTKKAEVELNENFETKTQALMKLRLLIKDTILLQSWKFASQQCKSYDWEESFTWSDLSDSRGTHDLGDHFGNKFGDLGDK
ncbi:hypothetical protein AVEN_251332-1 [Araneus ventricosus]|uniref:Uncharacterized protein n=1 Tax=Araneus ventricosus TaxID=182803 RepID=A0A4Y2QA67_ARAVE|nr:hypothetical protein AVEN_251332-1 [Araneus ventricosus]